MPIATRNDLLILNRGKLATNCDCICPTCDLILSQDELTLSLSAEDRVVYVVDTFGSNVGQNCKTNMQICQTGLWPGADYAGTFILTRTSPGVNTWRYNFPITSTICPGQSGQQDPFLQLTATCTNSDVISFGLTAAFRVLFHQDWSGSTCSVREKSQFDCTVRFRTGTVCVPGNNVVDTLTIQRSVNVSTTVSAAASDPTQLHVLDQSLTTQQFITSFMNSVLVSGTTRATTDTGSSAVVISFVPQ